MLLDPPQKEIWWKRWWKDPVGSNVIAAGLIGLLVFIGSFIQSWYSKTSIWESLKSIMLYRVPVWLLLAISILVVIIYKISNRNRNSFQDGHKMIGGFTFFELYLILNNNKVRHPEDFHGSAVHPDPVPIIQMFLSYKKLLNTGIEEGWDPFMDKILAPVLMNYRLVYLANEQNSAQQLIGRYYKMTELGNEFCILYERFRLFRDIQRKKLA